MSKEKEAANGQSEGSLASANNLDTTKAPSQNKWRCDEGEYETIKADILKFETVSLSDIQIRYSVSFPKAKSILTRMQEEVLVYKTPEKNGLDYKVRREILKKPLGAPGLPFGAIDFYEKHEH